MSHPNQVLLSATCRLPPTPRHFACVPLSPCPLEPYRSSPTPTLSIRAQLLICHLHRVLSGPIARLPLPPCQFRRNCSSSTPTVSLRARPLISCPDCVYSSSNTSATLTVSLQARALVFHPDCVSSTLSAHHLPRACLFEPEHSSPASTVPFRPQALVTHPDCLPSSTITRLPSHRRAVPMGKLVPPPIPIPTPGTGRCPDTCGYTRAIPYRLVVPDALLPLVCTRFPPC